MLSKLKKANAIIEYGILLTIVVMAIVGIQSYLQKHIQGRVKGESDLTLGHGIGLEWPEQTYTMKGSHSEVDKYDINDLEVQGDGVVKYTTSGSNWAVTYKQPVGSKIMKHKRGSRDVQDAANNPPGVDYPDLQYNDWNDKGWDI